jgi:hypothetical protein
MAGVKLSAIASGGAVNAATDVLVAVRSGTTDVLVTPSTNAATVTVADAGGDTTTSVLLAGGATGTQAVLSDAGLTYNATTNALTASTFVGALTGNADTATTATTASAVAVGGITGLGSNVATFLATPTSANLASAVTNETGSGALVFGTSPTIDTPSLTATLTAGASLANGNLCYMATADGKMELTDADAAATSAGLLAMCTATIAEDATGVFILSGLYTTSGLTPGATYYISGTPGAITATAPVGSADVVRVIGYALSSTLLWFNPDNTYIELA